MKIMLCQQAATYADKVANLATIEHLAAGAKAFDVNVLIFPELFLTGYNLKGQLRQLAEPIDGPGITRIRQIARRHQTAIICGFPEKVDEFVFNSAVAIDKKGEIAHCHHKVFLFGDEEKVLFTPGHEFKTFELAGKRCGLSICYDIEFPEVARHMAQSGASVLFNPTANMYPYTQVPLSLVRARALENGLVTVYANLCGEENGLIYTGQSAIVLPDGTDLVRAGCDPAFLIGDISQGLARNKSEPSSTQVFDLAKTQWLQ
ncbi:MAG: (R)-stereoselective amidase [Candidatus Celerinatantimonas neptuna]|nr:MAG: (R)-stereoselective amidase [Candidatus Celerinatantimonas neptuna]